MEWLTKLSIADLIYLILIAIVLFIFVIKYRYINKKLRPLLAFVALHFLLEFGSSYMFYALNRDNMILYHFFSPIGYIALCAFFYQIFTDAKQKYMLVISIPIYLFIVGIFTIFIEPVTEMNSLAYMVESLLVIYWCFTFFRTVLYRNTFYRPEYDPIFWTLVGLLFYFIGNFFTIGSLNYFIDNTQRELSTKVYYASYAFNYVLYITIGTVLLINFRDRTYE